MTLTKGGTYERSYSQRVLAFLLALTFIISTIATGGFSLRAKAESTTPVANASESGKIEYDNATIDYTSTLEDIGNRQYKYTLDLTTDIKDTDKSQNQFVSSDGYLEAPFTGNYLIRLWGGDGANGEGSNYNRGGQGGKGGYIYGVIELQKGDILYYKIGGNGEATLVNNDGGGANGDGGGHGNVGSYTVGGGGGYSAVYYFSQSEADDTFFGEGNYADKSTGKLLVPGGSIKESDRLTRAIMVAGGGGGGGAGDGFVLGYKATGQANGGNGGSMTSVTSSAITGDDKELAGTVYAGADGKSSGKVTKYIGKGATNVPAKKATDFTHLVVGVDANDWYKTVTDKVDGGAGSAGDMRGGAGGAGFCGGSGGIMTGLLVASNVGGGGGGSSFIKTGSGTNGTVNTNPTTVDISSMVSDSSNPGSGSTEGGYVEITLLADTTSDTDTNNLKWLDKLSFSATISDLFEITSRSTGVTGTGNNIVLSNATLTSGKAKIEVILKAKDSFGGGNNVNVFSDATEFSVTGPTGIDAKSINLSNDTSYANVPFDGFYATGNVVTREATDSSVVNVSDLYADSYGLTKNDTYQSISAIKVYDGATEKTDPVPAESKTYSVKFTVSPVGTTLAKVGTAAVVTTYEAVAIVDKKSNTVINGIDYDVTKTLSYDATEKCYVLTINAKTKPDQPALEFSQVVNDYTTKNITSDWTAPEAGYYMIQAWGGNGGRGQNIYFSCRLDFDFAKSHVINGYIGGAGGYVSGIKHLSSTDVVSVAIGSNGVNGSIIYGASSVGPSGSGLKKDDLYNSVLLTPITNGYFFDNEISVGQNQYAATSQGGFGGKATVVKVGSNAILVAAGGGGGGGAAVSFNDSRLLTSNENKSELSNYSVVGKNGSSVNNDASNYLASFDETKIDGSNGSVGRATQLGKSKRMGAFGGNCTGETYYVGGGEAGQNFRDASVKASASEAGITFDTGATSSFSSTGSSPAVKVTLVKADNPNKTATQIYDTLKAKIDGLELAADLSKYFAIKGEISASGGVDSQATVESTRSVASNAETYTISADYTWTIKFNPADGFLGGNGVPILNTTSKPTGITITKTDATLDATTINVPADATKDYANVAITTNPISVTPHDKTVSYGTSVSKTDLFTVTDGWTAYTGSNAWKADYVNKIESVQNGLPYTATDDKSFTYTYGIEPKSATGRNNIVDYATKISATQTANVTVDRVSEYGVTYSLTGLDYSGPDTITAGSDFSCSLKAKIGYTLPESVTVTIGGTSTDKFTYSNGQISIDKSNVTGDIVVTAAGAADTTIKSDLHFYWPKDNGEYNHEIYKDITVGATTVKVDDENKTFAELAESLKPSDESIPDEYSYGFHFEWNWQSENNAAMTSMPAYDFWVEGSYQPNFYKIEIQCIDVGADGELGGTDDTVIPYVLPDDYKDYLSDRYIKGVWVTLEDTFDAPSLIDEGYLLVDDSDTNFTIDETFVNGHLKAGSTDTLVFKIGYKHADGAIDISYKMSDSGVVYKAFDDNDGEYYSYSPTPAVVKVDAKDFAGYTPNVSSQNITVNKAIVTAEFIYTPNTYTVTFNPGTGATVTPTTKSVTFNDVYGDLPLPTKDYYKFDGWYTADPTDEDEFATAVEITDETVVTTSANNQTLYAKWTPIVYDITLALNGGTGSFNVKPKVYKQFTVEDDDFVIEVAPTKTGYNFDGWTGSGITTAQKKITIAQGSHDNRDYEAKWSPISYSVKFNGNDATSGSMSNETGFKYDEEKALTTNGFSRTGYTFAGWAESSTGAVKYSNSQKVKNLTTTDKATVDLYAKWTGIPYSVAFNANTGTGTMATQTGFVYGTGKALSSNTFTKTGYSFAGWATSGSGNVAYANNASVTDLTTTADATVTLYAKWTANTYKVAFNANGGTGTMTTQEGFTYDTAKALSENTFTRDGYTFAGWATSASGEVAYADKASVSDLTTKNGATVTLYAKWTANTYKVAFNANGGTGTMTTQEGFTYDTAKALSENTFTRDGYTFAGWATSASGEVAYADKASVSDLTTKNGATVTLYAKWTANTYKVAFNANGGTGTMTTQSGFTYGTAKALSENTFTRDGYTFAGWATSADGGKIYDNKASVSNLTATAGDTVTLYAVWTANTYEVSFKANGGSGSMSNQQFTYDAAAKALTANSYSKTGYIFTGWKDANDNTYTNKETVRNLATSGVFELTAQWTPIAYEVRFNANNGTGSMDNQEFTYDASQALTDNGFTRTGYSFDGWATSASGEKVYDNKASVSNLASANNAVVDIYVVWKVNNYTITYDLAGGELGTGKTNPENYTIESAAITLKNPTRTGYDFAGWEGTDLSAATQKVTIVAGSTGDRTYIATWTYNPTNFKVEMTGSGSTEYSDSNELKAIATVDEGTTVTYQWYIGDEPIDGATSATYDTKDLPAGNYEIKCVVTNSNGTDSTEKTVSKSVSVAKKTINVTIDDASKYLGQNDPTPFTYKVSAGEVTYVSGTVSRVTGDNIGKYKISGTGFDVVDAQKDNYQIGTITSGTLEIKALPESELNNKKAYLNPKDPDGNNGWYISQVEVCAPDGFTISESQNGPFVAKFTQDDGEYDSIEYYLKRTDGATTGKMTIDGYKQDRVAPTGLSIKIDSTTWSTFVDKIDVFNIFYKEPKTLTVTGTDALSGLDKIYYLVSSESMTLDQVKALGTGWSDITKDKMATIDTEGNKIVYLRVMDKAGNNSYISSEGFMIDKTAPVITATPSFTAGEWITTPNAQVTVVSITDNLSGVNTSTVSYKYTGVDKDPVNANSASFVIDNDALPDGNYTITITAKDKAGNEATKNITVKRESSNNLTEIFSDPSDVTVTYGDNAIFSISAISENKITSGIKSYQWQKSTDNGSTWTNISGATSDTYTLKTPQVKDSGSYYRVVVITNAGNEYASGSTNAKLIVNPRTITITPKALTTIYGTEESTVEVFPVNASTLDKYWVYYNNNKPINNEEVTFVGQFERVVGNTPNTYTISNPEGAKKVALDPNKDVNKNYVLEVFPTTANFEIKVVTDEAVAKLSPATPNGTNNWYVLDEETGEGVKLVAPSGYKISTTNALDDANWKDYLTFADGKYDAGTVTYYLKNTQTGAVTSAKTAPEFKQDTTVPTGTIKIDTSTWDKLLENITFGIYKSKDVSVTITGTDATSGINNGIKYIKSDKALAKSELLNMTWTTGTSFTEPAVNEAKLVVYAMITDDAGNAVIISSDGHVFDTVAPTITISGAEGTDVAPIEVNKDNSGGSSTAYADRILKVNDDNGNATVTVNGDPVDCGEDGYLLPNDGTTYEIVVKDQAGNETKYTITLQPITDPNNDNDFIDTINNDLGDNPTDEKIEEAIDKIDEILDNEVGDENSNITPEEKKALEDKKAELQKELDDRDAAREFVEKYASDNTNDPYDKRNDPVDPANEDQINQIISGVTPWDELTSDQQAKVNEIINTPVGDDESTYGENDTYKSYPDMLKDAVRDKIESLDLDDAQKADLEKKLDDPDTDTADEINDIYNDAIAQEFVNKYASTNPDNDPYDQKDDKVDPTNKNQIDQILSGETPWDELTPDQKAKVDEIINTPTDDETSYGEGDTYKSYKDMLQDAKDALDSAKQDAIDKINELDGLTDEEKQEYIDEINDAETIGEVDDILDDAVAQDFVNKYASTDPENDPYDKKDDKVDSTNEDQIISGSTDPDGDGDKKSPWDALTPEQQAKVDEIISTPSDSETASTAPDTYPTYPSYEEMLKDAVEQKIKDLDLTPGQESDLLGDLDKADSIDAINEVLDEALADDFVNKHASDGDASNPYDQHNDPVDSDNYTRVTSGEDDYNNLPKSVQDKIDEIINENPKDSGDEPYSGYKEMLDAAKAITPATDEDKEKAIEDLEKAAEEAIKNILDGKAAEDATPEEQDLIKDVNDKLDAAEKAINSTETPVETMNQLDKIVEDTEKAFNTDVAKDFVNEHASENDSTNPYDETISPVDSTNADRVISGESEYKNYEKSNPDVKDLIDDMINKNVSDGETPYDDYNDMLDAAKKVVAEDKAAAKKAVENGAEQAIKDILDGKNEEDATPDEQKLIDAVKQAEQEALNKLKDNHTNTEAEIKDAASKAQDAFDTAVAEDFVNEHASEDNYANPYDQNNDPVDSDNADRVLSGEDEYDKYVDNNRNGVVNKINELINTKSETSDDPYADYPTMLKEAKDVLDGAKDDAKNEIDKAAKDAIDEIQDLIDNGNLNDEDKAKAEQDIKDIQQAAEDAKDAIDEANSVDNVNDIVDSTEDDILNKVKDDAKNDINDAAQKAIDAINSSDLDDSDKQDAIDQINKDAEAATDAIDNADTVDDVKEAVADGEKNILDDVKDAAKDEIDRYAEEAKAVIDSLDNLTDEQKAEYKKAIDDAATEAKNNIDNAKTPDDVIDALNDGKDAIDDIVEDAMNRSKYVGEMIDKGYVRVDIKVEGLVDLDAKNADKLDDIKRILAESIDDRDVQTFVDGGYVTIVMTIREVEGDELNEKAIKADGATAVKHIEVIIVKEGHNAAGEVIYDAEITQTAEPITFVVPVDEYEQEGRVFYVYADHEGRKLAEKLPDGDGVKVTATVQFTTSNFSVFSVAYIDPEKTETETIVNTADDTRIFSTVMMLGFSAGAIVFAKKRREDESEED